MTSDGRSIDLKVVLVNGLGKDDPDKGGGL
jgi:hypothetical protein